MRFLRSSEGRLSVRGRVGTCNRSGPSTHDRAASSRRVRLDLQHSSASHGRGSDRLRRRWRPACPTTIRALQGTLPSSGATSGSASRPRSGEARARDELGLAVSPGVLVGTTSTPVDTTTDAIHRQGWRPVRTSRSTSVICRPSAWGSRDVNMRGEQQDFRVLHVDNLERPPLSRGSGNDQHGAP